MIMSYPKYVENYPLEKLTINNWNPNEMEAETVKKLKKSIAVPVSPKTAR